MRIHGPMLAKFTMLVSEDEQAGLSPTWPETPENRFCHDVSQLSCYLFRNLPYYLTSRMNTDEALHKI